MQGPWCRDSCGARAPRQSYRLRQIRSTVQVAPLKFLQLSNGLLAPSWLPMVSRKHLDTMVFTCQPGLCDSSIAHKSWSPRVAKSLVCLSANSLQGPSQREMAVGCRQDSTVLGRAGGEFRTAKTLDDQFEIPIEWIKRQKYW